METNAEKEARLRKEIKNLATKIHVAMSFDFDPLTVAKQLNDASTKAIELANLKLDEKTAEFLARRAN